ncbi:unnamed protein product [Cylicostephanus goldi]|uniref:Uncharacterized protein n=1 Tax=Cylicostephanus goldi TaxID=71465 RepID=A0A3P6RNR5_CYLGO|nr:unnamed protein product [Cylicostephanus goldi]
MSLIFLFICFVSFLVANAAIEEDPDCPAEWEIPETIVESKTDLGKLENPPLFEKIDEAIPEEALARPIETADEKVQRYVRIDLPPKLKCDEVIQWHNQKS